jgi:hypothetical protein
MISLIINSIDDVGIVARVASLAGTMSNVIVVVQQSEKRGLWQRAMPNAEVLTVAEYRNRRPRPTIDLIIVDTIGRLAYHDLVPGWRHLPCEVWLVNVPFSLQTAGWLGA